MKKVFLNIIEDFIRNIGGGLGNRLRYWYYKKRLNSCGKKVVIDSGVYFINPGSIRLNSNIWIDKNCILIAGTLEQTKNTKLIEQKGTIVPAGEIYIGSNSHIGIGTVIQGHGGVYLGEYFTSSAHCRIYSYSNDYRLSRKGTMETGDGEHLFYIMSPVNIGNNVWLGLNVSVIGAVIGDDVFVLPHASVHQPLEQNSVAGGNPARTLKKRFD